MHQVCLHRVAIVPAHEVQRTVSGEQIELDGERHAEPTGLARGGVRGDDDLAEQWTRGVRGLERERQDIGAPVNAAPLRIESTHLGVVDHPYLHDAGRPADGGQCAIDGAAKTSGRQWHAALALLNRRGHQEGSGCAPSSRAAAARVSWTP